MPDSAKPNLDAVLSRRGFLAAAAAAGGAVATGCTPSSTSDSGGGGKQISILDDNTNKLFDKGVIADFEKATGIKVVKYQQANVNDLHDRFATMFAARDASFDVVVTWAAWSAEFGSAGWLEPIGKGDVPDDLVPAALDAVSWQGQAYGLPKFASAQTMFYNKRLFEAAGLDPEKPPADWDSFVSAAKRTTKGGTYGFVGDMGNTDGAYQNFLRTLLGNGGTMYDDAGKPVFNSEQGVDALTRMVDLLRKDKSMAPSTTQISHSGDMATFFTNEKAAICFNWPFQYAEVAKKSSKLDKQHLGNALIPGISVRSASIDGSEGFAINKFSKNKGAAMEWLRYVTTPEVQRKMVTQEGWLPVSKSLLSDSEVVEALPVVKTYAEQAKYQIRRFGTPWYSQVVEDLAGNLTKAMLGQLSPKAALDASAEEAATIIKKFRK